MRTHDAIGRTIGGRVNGQPLGVGVIGLGVGEQHAKMFANDTGCYVAALCDFDDSRLAAVGTAHPKARRYSKATELIADPDVQIVAIASNDDDHAEQILQALRAGKHVFAEKPLCLNEKELREIHAAWEDAGVRLSTNTLLRRSPRFRWLQAEARAGRFGTIFSIEAEYVYGRLQKLVDGWRGKIPDYSVMLGGGIHMIDLMLWISNERPFVAMAMSSNLGSRGSGFTGDDLSAALLRFESGLIGKVGANFASVRPHHHRLLVSGTEATFDNTSVEFGRFWSERDSQTPPREIADAYPAVEKGALVPAFVAAIQGHGEPVVTEEEAFAAVSVALAIDKAAMTGKPVEIEYL